MDRSPDPGPGAPRTRRRASARAVAAALVTVAACGLVDAPVAEAVTYSPAATLLSGTPLTDADGVDSVTGATYVYDGTARKLFKLDSGGLVVATADLAASVTSASPATLSASASDIAVGAAKVYIADTGNHRVVSVPLLTTGTTTPPLTLEMGTGTAGGTFDGTAANSQLSSPGGLAVVTSGSTDVLYVADTGHHEVIRRTGTALSIVAGNGQAPPAVPGAVQLKLPSDVAVDPSGTLYVSDTGYDRIVSVSAGQLTTVASVTAPGPLAATASTLAVGSSSGIKAITVANSAVTDLAAGTSASGIDITGAGVVVASEAAGASSKVLTISPTAAPDAAPVISGPTTLSAAKGSTLSVPFTATGSPPPTWSLLESSAGAPALTVDPATGVLSGVLGASGTFTYRVQAANTLGRPNQVLTLAVGSVPATTSTKPTAVAAQGSATVTWTAPTASTSAAEAVTGYVLTPYAGGTAGTPRTLSPGTLTTTLTGLTSGTAYTFTVAATNAFGTAAASPPSAAVVPYGGVTAPPAGLTRVQGGNRVMTAVATSRQLFPGAGSARAVVVASSTSFADSLAGARLASAVGAPLLLTDPLALNSEVAAEVGRVLAVPPATTAGTTAGTTVAAAEAAGAAKPTTAGTVYLLGGTTAVSSDVETAVKAVNPRYAVTRISGADRYETAAKIATQVAVDDPVAGAPLYLASGRDYPDGLAVAALAARTGGVVLLTDGPTMPAATLTHLQKHDPNSELLVAVGGPAARATTGHGGDRALVGTDRYDTARLVAERFTAPAGSARVTAVGLATGDNWPDALAGAAAMGNLRGPLLLTPSASLSGSVGPAVAAASSAGRPSSALVFGGPTVVSASTATAFGTLVTG